MSIEMEVLERCDLCDTLLRWRFGNVNIKPAKVFSFRAHSPEFCRDLTKQKINMLTKMLRDGAVEMERMRRDAAQIYARLVAAERMLEEVDTGVRCPCCEAFVAATELNDGCWCHSCRALAGAPR